MTCAVCNERPSLPDNEHYCAECFADYFLDIENNGWF